MSDILKMLNQKKLAKFFDHTKLNADARREDFVKLCEDSKKYGFQMVAINPAPVKLCKELLTGTDIHVGAAIGFPLGQITSEMKLFETTQSIKNGSDEIDYVINITQLKEKNYTYIEKEMADIVEVCKNANVLSKVIFENCYLTNKEKEEVCKIALNIKPDYIKTSTGFGIGGAEINDIILMKKIVKDEIKIKAAGGIRDLESVINMIELGVSRIGSTSSVSIMEEYLKQL